MFRKTFQLFFSLALLGGLVALGVPQPSEAASPVRGGYDALAPGKLGSDGLSDSLKFSMAGANVTRDTLSSADNDTTASIQIAGAQRISVMFHKRDAQGTSGGQCTLQVFPQISNDNVNWVDITATEVVFSNFVTTQSTTSALVQPVIYLNMEALGDSAAAQGAMLGNGGSQASAKIAAVRLLRFRARTIQGARATPFTVGTADSVFLSGVYNISYK